MRQFSWRSAGAGAAAVLALTWLVAAGRDDGTLVVHRLVLVDDAGRPVAVLGVEDVWSESHGRLAPSAGLYLRGDGVHFLNAADPNPEVDGFVAMRPRPNDDAFPQPQDGWLVQVRALVTPFGEELNGRRARSGNQGNSR